ncbi:MAG: PAS domain-containing sensor histidine kinase [Acidimicrobiales bacterium]
MQWVSGEGEAGSNDASDAPSGCLVSSDRTVVATFGPWGPILARSIDDTACGSGGEAGVADRCGLVAAVDDFLASSADRRVRWFDLSAIDLGQRRLSLQRTFSTGNAAPQVLMTLASIEDDVIAGTAPPDQLLDRIPALAFMVDAEDRVVYLNHRTAALLEYEVGEVLGRRPNEMFGSGDVRVDILLSGNEVARDFGYHLVEISATELGLPMVRLHKSSLTVDGERYVAALGLDLGGHAVGRTRSSDREIQLGRLVDLIPAPIWVISRSRRIIRLNEAARSLASSTTSHLIGACVDTAYPKTARAVFGNPEDDFETLATGDGVAPTFASQLRDRVFRIDRTMLPGPGVSPSAMAVMLTDLSEVHGAQQELQMKNEVLEHRNAELDQFAHMASHDLRAPLRAIYAFTQMAMEEEGDEHRDHLGAILGSVDRMRSVLDSLLDYATADAHPVFAQVSLSDVVASVLGDLASDIAESDAVVKVGDLPTLHCDETAMRRLFQNLIANAITYAGDAPPSITITSTPEYRFVEIVVTDRGIGFAQHQEDDVFRPFKRLSADSKGQGIGLSMCRRIVESHHGTIRAITQVGGPTSMVIRLPRRRTL